MSIVTNVKMQVTPDLSERVQEIVFANGGKWIHIDANINRVINIYKSYLLINRNGNLAYMDEDIFNRDEREEISAYDFIASQGQQKRLPKYCEEAEFSDDGEKWHKAVFLSYVPSINYPFAVTTKNRSKTYKHCRPLLSKTHRFD